MKGSVTQNSCQPVSFESERQTIMSGSSCYSNECLQILFLSSKGIKIFNKSTSQWFPRIIQLKSSIFSLHFDCLAWRMKWMRKKNQQALPKKKNFWITQVKKYCLCHNLILLLLLLRKKTSTVPLRHYQMSASRFFAHFCSHLFHISFFSIERFLKFTQKHFFAIPPFHLHYPWELKRMPFTFSVSHNHTLFLSQSFPFQFSFLSSKYVSSFSSLNVFFTVWFFILSHSFAHSVLCTCILFSSLNANKKTISVYIKSEDTRRKQFIHTSSSLTLFGCCQHKFSSFENNFRNGCPIN